MNDIAARDREVVVGAGPIGLTTVLTLGQRGNRTLLIERPATAGILPKMDLRLRRLAAARAARPPRRLARGRAADATSTLELTTGRRPTTEATT